MQCLVRPLDLVLKQIQFFEHSNHDAVSRMYSARRGSKLYTLHIPTLIESSNRSVLNISYLENYIFLTNEVVSTK